MRQSSIDKTVMLDMLIELPEIDEQGHLMKGCKDRAFKPYGPT